MFGGATEDRRSINMGMRLVPSVSEPTCCPGWGALPGLCPAPCGSRMRSMGGILARARDAALKSQRGKPRRQRRGRAQRAEATRVNARRMSAKTSTRPRRMPCDWILCGGKRGPCFSQKKRLNIFLWEPMEGFLARSVDGLP